MRRSILPVFSATLLVAVMPRPSLAGGLGITVGYPLRL